MILIILTMNYSPFISQVLNNNISGIVNKYLLPLPYLNQLQEEIKGLYIEGYKHIDYHNYIQPYTKRYTYYCMGITVKKWFLNYFGYTQDHRKLYVWNKNLNF